MNGESVPEIIDETPKIELPQPEQISTGLKENTAVYSQKEVVLPLGTTASEPNYITPPTADKDSERKRVVIYIRASGNLERDLRKMKNIQGTLLSFPGKDYFAFQIFEKGKGTLIEFPNYTTKVCNELLDRLNQVVGPDKFQVEKVNIQ
jgi:DNA polymerase-3 subunit alpha